ncbi:hypothetical protein RB653_000847 [Dictyostelium firmibasis]|uniref:Sugar phosphate transporter domain-containing protein n=1 Tax=Dictyostelium firmibasis TaxID=79012 RepID=A0AAN7U3B4_9MYCE
MNVIPSIENEDCKEEKTDKILYNQYKDMEKNEQQQTKGIAVGDEEYEKYKNGGDEESPLIDNKAEKQYNKPSSEEEEDEEEEDSDNEALMCVCYSCYKKPKAKPMDRKKGFVSLFWVIVWIGLNMILFFMNKYLDDRNPPFVFPIFIIMTGTFSTFFGSCIAVFIFKISDFPIKELRQHKLLLFICSVFQAISYVMENISIDQMSIPLNQVIKATGPAFIIILSFILYRKTYPFSILFCTFIIIIGVVITIFTSPQIKLIGFLYAFGSIIFASIQTVLIARLVKNPKLNALALLVATSLPSALVCLPIFFIFEFKDLRDYNGPTTIPILSVVGLAVSACFYNLAHFYIVQFTSALYYVIIGNVKVVLVIIISSLVFANGFTPLNYLGAVVTMIGFILYNVFKYYENTGKNPPFITPFINCFIKCGCCQKVKSKKKSKRDSKNINQDGNDDDYDDDDDDDDDDNEYDDKKNNKIYKDSINGDGFID